MTSSKRRREVARAKAERQAARRAEAAERRSGRNRIIAVLAVVVVVGGALAWVLLNRSSDTTDVAAPTETVAPSEAVPSDDAAPSESAVPSDSAAPTDEPTTQPDPNCSPAPATRPDDMSWPEAPKDPVKPDTAYTMNLATNCGDIVIETLPAEAPKTVASMAFLTEEGYFDLTACHRLTTEGIFVLQCGDPAGNGTGGPGYAIPDENLPAEGAANYPAGTVAMANAGPGTGGSQFFIVYADTTLPSGYTIWGKVTKGLDVVEGIAAAGVEGGGTDGPPAQPVVIEKATLTTSPAN
ncbi:MAG: peptidylprolyl isomerase [Candidatus Nanopelagicales bacterium]